MSNIEIEMIEVLAAHIKRAGAEGDHADAAEGKMKAWPAW